MTIVERLRSKNHKNIVTSFWNRQMKVAHFLLIPELLYSPPNHAIINAYLESGYIVDIFSPGHLDPVTDYGSNVHIYQVTYSWLWLTRNIFSARWTGYSWISATSEDPLAIMGVLSFIYRKNSFALVDEIKSGGYRGDRSDLWKKLCKWSIRKARFKIVNDKHRVNLLMDYANIDKKDTIIVYPGCYFKRPETHNTKTLVKESWGFTSDTFVVGSSGGFNLTAGADWLLTAIKELTTISAVIQPLGVSPLSLFLLESLDLDGRLFIQKHRLGWFDAWKNSIGFDIGLSIYTNQAPQFMHMGISSNRLCMFIAMGVPIIASKQKSFEFLEVFDCGILVSTYEEFKLAILEIKRRHLVMSNNCDRCFSDYIQSASRYKELLQMLKNLKFRK
jgi:hypothetical protein